MAGATINNVKVLKEAPPLLAEGDAPLEGDEIIVVCPEVDALEIKRNIPCDIPIDDKGTPCGVIMPSTACLRLHQVKKHGITTCPADKLLEGRPKSKKFDKGGRRIIRYYCPAPGCPRQPGSGKPFSKLGLLKQHYWNVHAEKQYTCRVCSRRFGLMDVYNRHEKECGKRFRCTCGNIFRSRDALRAHTRRNGCVMPEDPVVSANFEVSKVKKTGASDPKKKARCASKDKYTKHRRLSTSTIPNSDENTSVDWSNTLSPCSVPSEIDELEPTRQSTIDFDITPIDVVIADPYEEDFMESVQLRDEAGDESRFSSYTSQASDLTEVSFTEFGGYENEFLKLWHNIESLDAGDALNLSLSGAEMDIPRSIDNSSD
eukprot:Clim_evm17s205 gene=Clim_evmTU17s205